MTGNQTERPERTTLVLSSEVNAYLDAQRAGMRRKTGTCMSRSALLRAMVRAAAELETDFSDCRNEDDIGVVLFCGSLEKQAPAEAATC